MHNRHLETMRELFATFSDMTRIRIIEALLDHEQCVSELIDKLNMEQSAVSHQLRVLRKRNIVTRRRKGKQYIYSLSDLHIKTLYMMARKHIKDCDTTNIDT